MSKKKKDLQILQVGLVNWSDHYELAENMDWHFLQPEGIAAFVENRLAQEEAFKTEQEHLAKLAEDGQGPLPKPKHKRPINYTVLLLTEADYPESLAGLTPFFEAYEVIYNQGTEPDTVWTKELLYRKMAHRVDMTDPQRLIEKIRASFYSGQYGAKMPVQDLRVTDNFRGNILVDGHSFLRLDGVYGDDFQQIAHFHYNIPQYALMSQKLFFEHLCGEGVETKIVVQLIQGGSLDHIAQEWVIEGNQTKEQFMIEAETDGYLAVSMYAKGQGQLAIGPCHYRYGRHEFGDFILGGQRLIDDEQQEIMYYFNPQDFKPPLCVYFSGFRTAEGFEGYWMMRAMGVPFMLICDPRLDGGSFYMGSEQLETAISNVIQEKLDFLGFTNDQLILSGLSMGTFGAAYHGSKLSPHAIVIGKPVFSLGEVALKEKINRPAGFPTSLDILRRYAGRMDQEGADELDERFWQQFKQGDFSKTTFAIAYMKDDDYDASAFAKVLESTKTSTAKVLGRGWQGRHGDGGSGPTNWFLRQYYTLLKNDFGRKY